VLSPILIVLIVRRGVRVGVRGATALLVVLLRVLVEIRLHHLAQLLLLSLVARCRLGHHITELSLDVVVLVSREVPDRLGQDLVSPLLLDFEVSHFDQTVNNSLCQFHFKIIRLEVFAQAVLKDIVPKVALYNLIKIRRVCELSQDLYLDSKWCLVDAVLNEL